jgi:ABC-type amino acid transport system permease subunit
LLLAGGLVYLLGMVFLFTKKRWHYFSLGFLAITLSTLLASLFFQFLYYLEVPLFPSPDTIITQIHPALLLSNKGLAFPTIDFNARFAEWAAFIAAGTALAVALWRFSGHVTETTGKPIPRGRLAILSIVGAALFGWIIVTAQPVPETITYTVADQTVTQPYDTALMESKLPPIEERRNAWYPMKLVMPEQGKNNYSRGIVVTPEYMGLLIGLVVYTSAFIAEIVRAGIQAVPYGQIEASRALGLTYSETLSLIILPQALRVIIPPLGNQYLNLAKNSSLAIAVAYADVYQVGLIFMNTSGQSLVAFTVIFLVYLTMSLIISFVMNIANSYFQIVSR